MTPDPDLHPGTWSAPGRVNLIGDHTDYNGGLALPLALPQRTVVTARRTTGDALVARSAGHEAVTVTLPARPEAPVDGWGAYVAGVAWALADAGVPVAAAELDIRSDVPVGAGLSSSHALECAVALALTGLAGVEPDPRSLARLVQRAENDYVGAPTGLLDQTVSLQARAGHLCLFDARAESVRHVPCDLAAAGLRLLVIDTRAPHRLTDGAYAERRAACERAAHLLGVPTLREVVDTDEALARLAGEPGLQRRARHVLTENARVLACLSLLEEGRLADLGPVLTASHASMRDDFENSVPEVDLAVESALGAGALGARMTGGGFGGSVVALVATSGQGAVGDAVRAAHREAGLAVPRLWSVTPSRGAGRGA